MATASNSQKTATPEFTITRTFNAPREAVWKAWSQPEHLAQWWGPKGCTLTVKKLDFKKDGVFHYAMQWVGAPALYGKFVYGDIDAPQQLSFKNSFSNEAGDVTRAPFSPTWPLEVSNIVTFIEQDGKTTVTLRGGPINPTSDEAMTFEMGFASMQQGFGGTFDQLDAYLAKTMK